MSKQSREKKAAIHKESLRQQSRNICFVAAAILYLFFLMGTFGDGYAYIVFFPILTGVFLIGVAIVYVPARACVERFIDVRLKRKKRRAFLLLALIPYLCCMGFFLFQFIDYNYVSSPEAIAKRAEKDFSYYQNLFNQNLSSLNHLNDTLMNKTEDIDDWWISEINHYNGNIINVKIGYKDIGYETILLESVKELSEQEKEKIRSLMENMCVKNTHANFFHNTFRIPLGARTEVHFTKTQNLMGNYYYIESSLVRIPLRDDWYFIIFTGPPFV